MSENKEQGAEITHLNIAEATAWPYSMLGWKSQFTPINMTNPYIQGKMQTNDQLQQVLSIGSLYMALGPTVPTDLEPETCPQRWSEGDQRQIPPGRFYIYKQNPNAYQEKVPRDVGRLKMSSHKMRYKLR